MPLPPIAGGGSGSEIITEATTTMRRNDRNGAKSNSDPTSAAEPPRADDETDSKAIPPQGMLKSLPTEVASPKPNRHRFFDVTAVEPSVLARWKQRASAPSSARTATTATTSPSISSTSTTPIRLLSHTVKSVAVSATAESATIEARTKASTDTTTEAPTNTQAITEELVTEPSNGATRSETIPPNAALVDPPAESVPLIREGVTRGAPVLEPKSHNTLVEASHGDTSPNGGLTIERNAATTTAVEATLECGPEEAAGIDTVAIMENTEAPKSTQAITEELVTEPSNGATRSETIPPIREGVTRGAPVLEPKSHITLVEASHGDNLPNGGLTIERDAATAIPMEATVKPGPEEAARIDTVAAMENTEAPKSTQAITEELVTEPSNGATRSETIPPNAALVDPPAESVPLIREGVTRVAPVLEPKSHNTLVEASHGDTLPNGGLTIERNAATTTADEATLKCGPEEAARIDTVAAMDAARIDTVAVMEAARIDTVAAMDTTSTTDGPPKDPLRLRPSHHDVHVNVSTDTTSTIPLTKKRSRPPEASTLPAAAAQKRKGKVPSLTLSQLHTPRMNSFPLLYNEVSVSAISRWMMGGPSVTLRTKSTTESCVTTSARFRYCSGCHMFGHYETDCPVQPHPYRPKEDIGVDDDARYDVTMELCQGFWIEQRSKPAADESDDEDHASPSEDVTEIDGFVIKAVADKKGSSKSTATALYRGPTQLQVGGMVAWFLGDTSASRRAVGTGLVTQVDQAHVWVTVGPTIEPQAGSGKVDVARAASAMYPNKDSVVRLPAGHVYVVTETHPPLQRDGTRKLPKIQSRLRSYHQKFESIRR